MLVPAAANDDDHGSPRMKTAINCVCYFPRGSLDVPQAVARTLEHLRRLPGLRDAQGSCRIGEACLDIQRAAPETLQERVRALGRPCERIALEATERNAAGEEFNRYSWTIDAERASGLPPTAHAMPFRRVIQDDVLSVSVADVFLASCGGDAATRTLLGVLEMAATALGAYYGFMDGDRVWDTHGTSTYHGASIEPIHPAYAAEEFYWWHCVADRRTTVRRVGWANLWNAEVVRLLDARGALADLPQESFVMFEKPQRIGGHITRLGSGHAIVQLTQDVLDSAGGSVGGGWGGLGEMQGGKLNYARCEWRRRLRESGLML